ncbi:MAG TPA: hypothetical protein VET46_00260, partial [Steroidobacteraceae bacterium]|nr:hypothetical protein [Steroidobacteraceae bacterium]
SAASAGTEAMHTSREKMGRLSMEHSRRLSFAGGYDGTQRAVPALRRSLAPVRRRILFKYQTFGR